MKENLRNRFSALLEPSHVNFNPLPAAACLLDPTCAPAILSFETSDLREKAKEYILSQVIETKTLLRTFIKFFHFKTKLKPRLFKLAIIG